MLSCFLKTDMNKSNFTVCLIQRSNIGRPQPIFPGGKLVKSILKETDILLVNVRNPFWRKYTRRIVIKMGLPGTKLLRELRPLRIF